MGDGEERLSHDEDGMDHDEECKNGAEHGTGGPGPGGPDTSFVQFEISEMLRAAGTRAFEEAVHKTLVEFVQAELRSRYAEPLRELAALAVEQAVSEVRRNSVIEQLVKEHKAHQDELRKKAVGVVAGIVKKSGL